MNEPIRFTQGDTQKWNESFCGYPASDGWELNYLIRGPVALDLEFETDIVANGDGFDITLSAEDSATLTEGTYLFQGKVSKAGEVHTVTQRHVTIDPDLTEVDDATDVRSDAQIMLDNVNAAITKILAKPNVEVEIAGRRYRKEQLKDLYEMRQRLRSEVKKEQDDELIANGKRPQRVQTVFV